MAQSTDVAPEAKTYRKGVASVDSLPQTDQRQGVNAGHYRSLHINVLPSGGADPTVAVLYWSPKAGVFIQENPAFTKAGVGADVPYAFTVEARGRILFVAVTVLAAGSVDIETSGYDLDHSL